MFILKALLGMALTPILSSFGDIKSGRVMPWMASAERTGRAERSIHRVPQFDVAITDRRMGGKSIVWSGAMPDSLLFWYY
jgi:hypothetical protein